MAYRVYTQQQNGAPSTIKMSKTYKQGSLQDTEKKLAEEIMRYGQQNAGLNATRESVNSSPDFASYAASLAKMLSQNPNVSIDFAYGLPTCTFVKGKAGKYGIDTEAIERFAYGNIAGTGILDKYGLFKKSNRYVGAQAIEQSWKNLNSRRSLTGKSAEADAEYIEEALKLYYQVSSTGNTMLDNNINSVFDVIRKGIANNYNEYRDRLLVKGGQETAKESYPNLYRWLHESISPVEFTQAASRIAMK